MKKFLVLLAVLLLACAASAADDTELEEQFETAISRAAPNAIEPDVEISDMVVTIEYKTASANATDMSMGIAAIVGIYQGLAIEYGLPDLTATIKTTEGTPAAVYYCPSERAIEAQTDDQIMSLLDQILQTMIPIECDCKK